LRGSDDPGEGEALAGRRAGVEVVQAAVRRGGDVLLVGGASVADLVPLDAGAGVIAVGRDLHGRSRTVLVVPAEAANQFLAPAVTPQRQLVLLDGVDAELALLAGADALRPGVAEQAVGQQTEMVRSRQGQRQADALGAEAGPVQHDAVT